MFFICFSDDHALVNPNDGPDYQFDESPAISPNSVCDSFDPDMYFCHSRQPSCSASSWASSPCENNDELAVANYPFCPAPVRSNTALVSDLRDSNLYRTPDLNRQMSLNVVMEVLRTCPVDDTHPNVDLGIFIPPASSLVDDGAYMAHPSPAYSEVSAPARNRTFSEFLPSLPDMLPHEDYYRTRAHSSDPGCAHYVTDPDIAFPFTHYAEENATAAPAVYENDNNTSSVIDPSDNPLCVSAPSSTSTARLPCLDYPENSLDMVGMLEDFLSSTDPAKQSVPFPDGNQTVAVETGIETAMEVADIPTPSPAIQTAPTTPAQVVDLTEVTPSSSHADSSVTEMKRTPSYKRKRSRNNKACKESRKKRKLHQKDAELKVTELTVENEELRNRIKVLEVDVQKTKEEVFARMKRKA